MPTEMTLADAALRVFPNVFLFDGGRYVVATLLMTAIVALVLRSPWRVRRLQERRASRADLQRELSSSLRSVVIYALVSTPALWLTANGYTAGFYTGTPSLPEIAAFTGALLVAHDSWFYWLHRAMHDPRLFKRFHRLHHRSVTPTPFAAYAFNTAEAVFEALFVSLWVALISHPLHCHLPLPRHHDPAQCHGPCRRRTAAAGLCRSLVLGAFRHHDAS